MTDSSDDRTLLSDSEAIATEIDGDESYCAACGKSYPMSLDTCPNDGARLTKLKAQPDALLGRVFDNRYEVRTSLGQGGMGTVYRGWQMTVDREIAIKVIHPKLASDRTAVKRFLREARLSSRLNQPNIVNVYDFGQTEDGILFIAMELVRGHTLGRELESMRPMSLKRVLTIGQQLCDALDSAHGQGIVHRDLKPNNIIILDDPPGRDLIKVLDFGLAKSLVTDTSSLVTNTNAILGTPLYMPPEQIDGKPSDQRSDLYSFGCILYQMLSGRPPFVGDTVQLVLAAHVSDEPPPLPTAVPPMLVRVVDKLMEKDPAKRMASAREAREAMQAILEGGTYAAGEVYDTTPDVRPSMLLQDSSAPIALAVTDPAGLSRSQPPDAPQAIDLQPTARRWLWPLVVVLVGLVGAFVAVKLVTNDPKPAPPRAVVVPDAAQPMTADTGIVPADAANVVEPDVAATAVEIDAAEVVPPDAKKSRTRDAKRATPKDAAQPLAVPIDAALPAPALPLDAPEIKLDFIKDAKPKS